jgi:GH24 family phage-related lysozyme (muramidase)
VRPSVASVLPAFQTVFEGRCTWPYLDIKGLATVGIGCLIEPEAVFETLPWQVLGQPATHDYIAKSWLDLKGAEGLCPQGGGVFEGVTDLRLTDAAIDSLLVLRSATNDSILAAKFTGYQEMPANVQLALLSMAWAAGPYVFAEFPLFCSALEAGDWATCAIQCHMDDSKNPGLVPRNKANEALFLAASLDDGEHTDAVAWP